ncbi:MAG: SRPBCC family protein [Pseudomonadota bacterium]
MDAKSQLRETSAEQALPQLLPGRQQVLSITRFLPAAPATVYALWTDASQLLHWYAPKDFAVALCEGDTAVGSRWRIVLRRDAEQAFTVQRQFLQVEPARRLVYMEQCLYGDSYTNTDSELDSGQGAGSSHVFYDAMTQVTFEKLANKTKLTVRAEPQNHYSEADIAEWLRGCNALLDRLNAALRQR